MPSWRRAVPWGVLAAGIAFSGFLLTLTRPGVFYSGDAVNRDLWTWLEDVASGKRPVRRYDGIVEVMSVGSTVVARWLFERGLPARITGPQLNAKTGEIAIEELHIAHEGLRLVAN